MNIITCVVNGTRFYLSPVRLATNDVTRGEWFKSQELAEHIAREENRLPIWYRFGFNWTVQSLD